MSHYRRFLDRTTDKLPLLTVIFCVLQPVLDVIGYWQNEFGLPNTFTLLLRMFLLCGSVLLGFLLSDRKRAYWIMAAVLCGLTMGHIYACTRVGYEQPITDLVNLVRIYLMPMTVLCFITFLKKNDKVFPALKRGMAYCLGIIAAVQLISTLTGTDPHTYDSDKTGVLGWFMWTNSQSAILSMLAPVSIAWALKRWPDKIVPTVAVTLVAEGTLYFLAPRLAYAGLIAAGLGMGVSVLLASRRQLRQGVAVLLCTAIVIGCYPISPTRSRQTSVSDNTKKNQESINEIVQSVPIGIKAPSSKDDDEVKTQEELDEEKAFMESLERIYTSYLYGLVKRFGIERVAEAYDYSIDSYVIGNARTKKITFCQLLMEESPGSSFWFGLNLKRMQEEMVVLDKRTGEWVNGYENYDVENDFHGIFYLCGMVGLILMIAFLLFFGLRALLRMCGNFKAYFTVDFAAFCIAYCSALVHAYCTASVLRRNNGSVYLSFILAGMWYLSRKEIGKKHGEETAIAG